MSMTEKKWQPGDLAVVTTRSGREYRATYVHAPGIDYYWQPLDGESGGGLIDPDMSARPLAVIDPEDREQVERLSRIYTDREVNPGVAAIPRLVADRLQAALREYTNPKPPKPEEPGNFAAVVIDSTGVRWVAGAGVHGGRRWESEGVGSEPAYYTEIDAVRVLSEGVPTEVTP